MEYVLIIVCLWNLILSIFLFSLNSKIQGFAAECASAMKKVVEAIHAHSTLIQIFQEGIDDMVPPGKVN